MLSLFVKITSNPLAYPDFGSSVSRTIANSFANHSANPIDMQGITISVISLEKIAQAITDINDLSDHLLRTVTDVPSSLLMATAVDSASKFGVVRTSSAGQGWESSGQVDLSGLLFHISEKFPVLRYLIDNVQKSLKNALLYNIEGDSNPNATGLSIYMPISSDQFELNNSTDYALSGWQYVINNQKFLLNQNNEYPSIHANNDQGTIKAHINGTGISRVILTYYNSSTFIPDYNSLFYGITIAGQPVVSPDGSFEVQIR